MSAEQIAKALEELWGLGNCAGLDGWVGPDRGHGEFDEEAVNIRRRDIEKTASVLAPLFAEAQAEALREAADEGWADLLARARETRSIPGGDYLRDWLRARAAAINPEGAGE